MSVSLRKAISLFFSRTDSAETKRSMASSKIEINLISKAVWRKWTTRQAVSEGYKVSGWVFKSVSMITRNASSVPWCVQDKNGEFIPDHPISKLLKNPSPQFSRQSFFELICAWQQLSGEAYLKRVFDSNGTAELWPISPDRIAPIPSSETDGLISGYEIIDEKGNKVVSKDYTTDNVIGFLFIDPSNPIRGIGPLQVAAKAVDIDTDQQNWNKSAMQNRGIVDGVFTFDKDLDSKTALTYKQRIKEMFFGQANARDIAVIGSNAKYQRLSLTPTEMDFVVSRKFNMEEIFIIFGIPPQLAGSQEASTYNNFAASNRIFWEMTIIPILDDIKDTLNHALAEELGDDYTINYDVSGIAALKQDQKEQVDIAKVYTEMGVPVSVVNEMMTLGITEYEGWDKSSSIQPQTAVEKRGAENDLMLKKFERRNIDDEIKKKETLALNAVNSFNAAFAEQQKAAFLAMENKEDIAGVLANNSAKMIDVLTDFYQRTAETFAESVVTGSRAKSVDFETREVSAQLREKIEAALEIESVILTELSLINKTTIASIFEAIIDGEEEGKSINDIQQSIIDSGTFSSERALRIARTVSGTAQSIGQMDGIFA